MTARKVLTIKIKAPELLPRFQATPQMDRGQLTHGEEAPCDGRRGEAGEHIVRAGEVGEVGQGH